jgi:hypothetical protein
VSSFPNHKRIVFGGTFFTSEIWSCGINMSDAGAVTDDARRNWCTSYLSAVAAHVKTWFQWNTSGFSSQCRLTFCKVNAVGEDGKYLDQESNTWDYPAPLAPGTLAGAAHSWAPPQIALAVSLRTGLRAGRGSVGRVFIPCAQLDTVGSGASPYVSATQALSVATAMKDFIHLLNAVDPDLVKAQVCVVSKSNATHGAKTTDVNAVRIGNAFDTIQTRRNKLRETYQEIAV